MSQQRDEPTLTPTGSRVWLLRLTKGRIARLWHRRVLILITRGRKSGLERTVPLQFLPDGDGMIVVAANSGLPSPPGWYFNLTADPRARVEVGDSRSGACLAMRTSTHDRRPSDRLPAW